MPTFPRLLLASITLLSCSRTHAQTARPSLTGNWAGTLTGTLDFTAHLTDPASGPRTATLDIPAQKAQGLVMQFTTHADSVYLRLRQPVAAQFAGRRSADGQQLVGEW